MNNNTPKNLTKSENFKDIAINSIDDETQIFRVQIDNEKIENEDFSKVEIRNSVISKCIFSNCDFENASFIDVVFNNCDLSSSKFFGSYFQRCEFISCKCIGTYFNETIIKQTTFISTNLQYTSFDKGKLTDIKADNSDFTSASISCVALKNFTANESRFIKTNFFKTPLLKMDFSNSEFVAPIISKEATEIKGLVLNMLQATNLISHFGVVVK